jgi:hypothetical protein
MGRFASALAFVFMLGVILSSAGCGERFDELGAGQAPAAADLAADALQALEDAGSAHVVLDAQSTAIAGSEFTLGVHFEGDASKSAIVGDGEVRFPGATLGARLLVDEHDVYVRFMGAWYGDDMGIADALAAAGKATSDDLLTELMSVAGLRARFGGLFAGEVTEGPAVDGFETWKFEGRFRADAFAQLTEKYDHVKLTEHDRGLLDRIAASTRLVLVVGRDDRLPRSLQFSIAPPQGLDFDADELESGGSTTMSARIELSGFGTGVSLEAPKDVRPLSELADRIFGGFE